MTPAMRWALGGQVGQRLNLDAEIYNDPCADLTATCPPGAPGIPAWFPMHDTAEIQGYVIGHEVIDDHLVVYLGEEDSDRNPYFISLDFGRMDPVSFVYVSDYPTRDTEAGGDLREHQFSVPTLASLVHGLDGACILTNLQLEPGLRSGLYSADQLQTLWSWNKFAKQEAADVVRRAAMPPVKEQVALVIAQESVAKAYYEWDLTISRGSSRSGVPSQLASIVNRRLTVVDEAGVLFADDLTYSFRRAKWGPVPAP